MDHTKTIAWVRANPWTSAGIVLAAVIVLFLASVVMRTPRGDRKWDPHLAYMPAIAQTVDAFALNPVLDWSYTREGTVDQSHTKFGARFADLRNVWLMVEPQPGQAYAAHTLLLFEFGDQSMIGLTIEARLEAHETYDAFAGLFNNFELAFIWATPKELLTRRAVMLKKDVYVYPLTLSAEQRLALLRGLLDRTREVAARPDFYNTFTSNCTNELAKVAGLGWHYSWVLTGYSPQRLFDLKFIPGADFETARKSALMSPEIASWNSQASAEFTKLLIAELHRRLVAPAS